MRDGRTCAVVAGPTRDGRIEQEQEGEMKRQLTSVVGIVLAATLVFPVVASAANLAGAARVGSTELDFRKDPMREHERHVITYDCGESLIVQCGCRTHRAPSL
jgi:hypothetical protein